MPLQSYRATQGPMSPHDGRVGQHIRTVHDTACKGEAGTAAVPPVIVRSAPDVPCKDGSGKQHSHAVDAR